MAYKTHDGEPVQGTTPQEIVASLKAGSRFDSLKSDKDFSKGLAMRWKNYSGKDVRTTNPKVFVEDLIETKFLIKTRN